MKRHLAVLIAALALGGAFRFSHLDWGRPTVFHPDEARISYAIGDIDRQVAAVAAKAARGERVTLLERLDSHNPHFFAYGSLPLFLIRGAQRLFPRRDLFAVGRAWSAFFDTLTILFVYLLGARLFSRRAGCLAALFFAFAVLHIQLAHLLTVDVMLASLVTASVYFSARVMEGGRFRAYALAGVMAGLALATKVTAAPVLLPLLFAHGALCARRRRFLSPVQWGKLLAALLLTGAVFAAAEPFFFRDHAEFMRQLVEQRNMVQGRWAPPWTLQYEHTVRGFYQLKNLLAYCLGIPAGAALLLGAAFLVARTARRPDRGVLLVLAWLVPVAAATLSFKVKFLRYLAPLIPFLCVLGAGGICLIIGEAGSRLRRRLLVLAAGLAVAFSFFYALAYMSVYRHEDTRVAASDWIYRNVPPRSQILGETWEFCVLPTGTSAGDPGRFRYAVTALDIYRADDRGKARLLAGQLAAGDYIALPTKRMYGSVLRVPDRYPITANYYRLLFEGRLGYTLVKSFTSYPRLAGVVFNDDFADESFTVYEHPKVLIFKNTARLPADGIERLLRAEPKIDWWPVLDEALAASEDRAPWGRGGAASPLDAGAGGGRTGVWALIAWLAMAEALGLIALPIASSLFGGLKDRGAPFAKTLAIALAGWLVWLAASLHAVPFSLSGILAAYGLVLLVSIRLAARGCGWRGFTGETAKAACASEAVFLASFLLFLLFRLYNPDIFWSESSMDFSFINSILRSRYFPPIDPWASGVYLNYYYYGHYLVAMLTKLSGVPSTVGYPLSFCLIPALVISSVFSIVLTLAGRIRWGLAGAAAAGLLGNLDGLLLWVDTCPWRDIFYRFLHISPATHAEHSYRFFRCAHELIPNTVHEFPLWSFIFVDLHAHIIAMPFALLLLARALDLMLWRSPPGRECTSTGESRAVNFAATALVLGMLVPTNTWDFPTIGGVLALGFLAREVVRRRHAPRVLPLAEYSIWWSCGFGGRLILAIMSLARLEGPVGRPLGVLFRTAWAFVPLAAAAVAAYAPFFQFFGREGMGIGLVGELTTPAGALLRFFGLFLFVIASYVAMEALLFLDGARGLRRRLVLVLLLLAAAAAPWYAFSPLGARSCAALSRALASAAPRLAFAAPGLRDYAALSLVLALLFPGLIALGRNRRDARAVFAIALVLYGLAIVATCEIFHIRDFLQGGGWKRMNTIFKFYMPVWFFFSIGCAFFLSRIAAHPPCALSGARRALSLSKRAAWWTALAALAAASLVFTVMGPRARTTGDDLYGRVSLKPPMGGRSGLLNALLPQALTDPTLDGLAFLKDRLPDEYEAVMWLRRSLGGQPVIVEATLEDYRYEYARISANTGLPAVLGWWSHVDQRGYPHRDIRKNDVFAFFKSADPAELRTLIAKYDIGYVYIGDTERRIYKPDALAKFDGMVDLFTPVFRNKTVAIYRAARSTRPAAAGAMGKEATPVPTAAPRVSLLDGGEGSAPGEYNEPRGVAVDGKGNVYVADFRNYRIQKFGPDGLFLCAWGEEGSYPGQFNDPCDVKTDAKGRVYVADTFNHRVQALSPEGKSAAVFEGGLFAPRGVAVDAKGRIWVADTGNSAVKLFTAEGEPPRVIGGRGKGNGEFDSPVGLAVDRKGRVYVADAGNGRVQVLDQAGNYLSQFKVDGWKQGVFNEPYLDVDARGDIYLTDPPGHRVLKYSPAGKILGTWRPAEGSGTLLEFPMGIAVQKDGDAVYVVDCRHHRVRKASKKDFR